MAKKITDETLKFNIIVNGDSAKKEYGQLERANRKLITTSKDYENQLAKLKKAGLENSDEYKKMSQEMDFNSKTIELNKTKMQGLTKEIGLNNLTMRQLGKEAGRLGGILSNIDKELHPERWEKYSEQLKSVKGRQANLREELKPVNEAMSQQMDELDGLTSGFMQFFTSIRTGDYKGASEGLQGITGGLKAATRSAMAFIATPVGAAIAALAAIGFIAREWFNYNDTIKESVILTEQITRATGANADAIRLRNQALKQTFGVEEKESLETARNLVEQFGISYAEAFDVIEDGLVKGQKNNNEYFDSLKEYPTFFAQAEYSAQQFKDIISAGYDLGIYNDKLPDAIKEFDISMREQTKSTREALVNAFGAPFTNDILERVKNGSTTTKDALIEVSEEAQRQGLNIQQNAQLTADLFRGAGEDVGGAIKILEAIDVAANNANRALTPLEASTRELVEANLDLARAQDEALKSDDFISFTRDVSIFWKKIKTLFYDGISYISDLFFSVQKTLVTTITALIITARQLPSTLIEGVKEVAVSVLNTIKTLSQLGDVIDNLMDFNFSGAKESYQKFKNDFETNFNGIKKSAKDTVAEIIKTQQVAQEVAIKQFESRRAGNVAAVELEKTNEEDEAKRLAEEKAKAEEDARAKALAEKQAAIYAEMESKELDRMRAFEEKRRALQNEIALENEESDLQRELLKEEQRLEKEILDLEKLALTEAEKGELLTLIEEQSLLNRENIREKYQAKQLADQKKLNEQLIAVENDLVKAKQNALDAGINAVMSAFKEQTVIGKAMFLYQKGAAIAEILTHTAKANAVISSSLAIANMQAVALSPMTGGLPFTVANTIQAGKATLTNNLNAAAQIATIGASTLKGFEDGLYPITREQDGKVYNSKLSNNTSTQVVGSPTAFLAGERPEMIIDPGTFKKMDPRVKDYILNLAGRGPSNQGSAAPVPTQTEVTDTASSNDNNEMLMQAIGIMAKLNEQLEKGIVAKTIYGIDEELSRQDVQKEIDETIKASKE